MNRVKAIGLSKDLNSVVYEVAKVDVASNTKSKQKFSIPITGGEPIKVEDAKALTGDENVSPDGNFRVVEKEVKLNKVFGTDFYPELDSANVQIYNELSYRHWDEWEDGAFGHLFIESVDGSGAPIDILLNEPFDCPQKPFGDDADYIWSPDSKRLLYVTKKKSGTAYAKSTNTDIYEYDIASKKNQKPHRIQ